ncbi:hypothetical protein EJF36_05075 [Bacillus sp. HMF5848]|uniref:hypothetical protein n=1 Tax=Bacillus sp. HMF5848 TaxID=2495421 RepID=UPI000F777501|nr:hypothetical protein [Bacillus sp. HMF5848]RSK26280.1 hypothetical protein EJF36_05075 [Bacillus sp. HMF5848]
MDIDLFPEEHELIDIFESEPTEIDEDMPWYYNELRFYLKRNENVLEAIISPAISDIKLRWHNQKHILASLHLEDVKGIKIEKKDGTESLCIMFEDLLVKDLIITTKPYISISWGTNRNV